LRKEPGVRDKKAKGFRNTCGKKKTRNEKSKGIGREVRSVGGKRNGRA